MTKILVSFYSRSGNTKKVAKSISKKLNGEMDEISDKKKRSGPLGFIGGGKDALKKNLTEIDNKKNPSEYDLVVIGTPVWAGTVTPAIRTYLSKNKFKKLAFFCTCSRESERTFNEMKEVSKKPIATLCLNKSEMKDFDNKVKEFCNEIKKSI